MPCLAYLRTLLLRFRRRRNPPSALFFVDCVRQSFRFLVDAYAFKEASNESVQFPRPYGRVAFRTTTHCILVIYESPDVWVEFSMFHDPAIPSLYLGAIAHYFSPEETPRAPLRHGRHPSYREIIQASVVEYAELTQKYIDRVLSLPASSWMDVHAQSIVDAHRAYLQMTGRPFPVAEDHPAEGLPGTTGRTES